MVTIYNPSYSEYLSSVLHIWPEFRQLHEFFANPPSGPGTGKAIIIDEIGGNFNVQHFTADSEIVPLRLALSHRVPESKQRIVILQYSDINNISRKLVDVIATEHYIEPLLLCRHFLNGEKSGGYSVDRQLNLQGNAFEFGFTKILHTSILFFPWTETDEASFQQDTRSWTAVILLRSPASGCKSSAFELETLARCDPRGLLSRIATFTDISERFISQLQREAENSERPQSVLELLLPLYQLVIIEIKHHFHTSSQGWKGDKVIQLLNNPKAATRLEELDYDFTANLYRIRINSDVNALRETIDSLTHSCGSRCLLPADIVTELRDGIGWQQLRGDLECLLEEVMCSRNDFETYGARALNRLTLTAATESLEQSRSMGRLTILAFVFIPM